MPKDFTQPNSKSSIEPYSNNHKPRKPIQSQKEKDSINHEQSGALVADQNSFKGVVLKYSYRLEV